MPDILSTILSAAATVSNQDLHDEEAKVGIAPIAENGQPLSYMSLALQHWPSQITDTEGSTYSNKTIPGGNRPIYQWIAGGERQISFSAIFSRDKRSTLSIADYGEFNVDIAAAIAWLRALKAPDYKQGSDYPDSPPVMYLIVPNHWLSQTEENEDNLLVKMDQCDVTYRKAFPGGTPRLAEVQLTFTETVQNPVTGVKWYGISQMIGGDPRTGNTLYKYWQNKK
jgi:hypothetical protein